MEGGGHTSPEPLSNGVWCLLFLERIVSPLREKSGFCTRGIQCGRVSGCFGTLSVNWEATGDVTEEYETRYTPKNKQQ